MQPDIRDAGYLWDMLDAARTIREFTVDVSDHAFMRDRKLQLAIERCLEIIGEAARGVSTEYRELTPYIPWRLIIAQRNVIAHEYGEIKQERIWVLVRENIPELIEKLEAIEMPAIPDIEE